MKDHKAAAHPVSVISILLALTMIVISAAGCQSNYGSGYARGGEAEENYYTVEQAQRIIADEGYNLGNDIDIRSEDGQFYYKANLATEEFNFCTVSGSVEFTAEYDGISWNTRLEPQVDYEWHLSGSWYAETEHYDVYMDIKSFTGSNLRVVLEAQYDSLAGGKGSYGVHDQMISLGFASTETHDVGMYEVFLYGEVSGGYPIFQLYIDKDTMTVWQLYDSYKAELTPLS